MDLLHQLWPTIKETIQKEYNITDIAYNTWVKPLELYSVEDKLVLIKISFDNKQALDYTSSRFKDYFKNTISDMMAEEYEIRFILNNDSSDSLNDIEDYSPENTSTLSIDKTNLNPTNTFDTLVVGGYNKLAHSAALAVAQNPGTTYNPLYLYGGPGLGKTHLIQSIGHEILKNNKNAHILYVTSEEFTNEVIESIRSGNALAMTKFREKYRTVDVLIVDDIQFIIGKESTQEEFFHTFNALHSAGKQIILTSDKAPKALETLDVRYTSRFGWGMIADITAPDYETRMAILRKKSENFNKKIDDNIIQYISNNIKSNIRELEGALNKIMAFSKLNNVPITLSMTEEALKDMIYPDLEREVTPDLILQVVCEHFNIIEQSVLSAKKTKDISNIRQIIMYLCREFIPDMSLKNIAEFLGKKDHTTIMHGISKIEQDIKQDDALKNKVDNIKKKLYS